ncbi:MAG TPA: hypothetical protein VK599_12270 [Streptosporangiaceae bacterium]|nr:hypothetical protein [Streptosporangiaceae bacterium]
MNRPAKLLSEAADALDGAHRDAGAAVREIAALVAAVVARGPASLDAQLRPVMDRLDIGPGASPAEAEKRIRRALGLAGTGKVA